MKQLFKIALSIGVSFAILALLLQAVTAGVPDSQRPGVLSALQGTSFSLVFAYLGLYLITLLIRAFRYRLLLQVAGEENVPSMRQMALVTGIRNMVVDMLPARLGELGYIGLLNRGYGVKLQHCVSSLTISIAFDLIALLVVVALIFLKQLLGAGVEDWAIMALVSAFALSMIAVLGLFLLTPTVNYWAQARFSNVGKPDGLFGKALRLLADFSDSLVTVRQAGATIRLLVLSVVIRMLKYFGFYLLFKAVAVPSFQALAQLPVEQVVSALIGGELGASLPIPTFMSFGAYEAGTALVFQLLGITDQAAGLVTMLCVHIWSQTVEYIIGGALVALFIFLKRRANSAVERVRPERRPLAQWVAVGAVSAVFVLGSSFLAWELRAAKKLGSLSAPAAGEVSSDALQWQKHSADHVSTIEGFAVFSSNRDGNHDIFKLNFSDFELSKLTTHPHTETYPRISPDGRRVVFSRAHQPWVSQRNSVAWDIYLLDLISGEERKIGENGTASHWIDANHISYLQNATTVVKVAVDTGESSVLYQTGLNNRMPAGAHIQNPKVNPLSGEVVFTGRQNQIGINSGHWGTAITMGAEHKGLYNGCEIGWTSDGTGLYQVTSGGRDNDLRIIKIDPQSFAETTLIDLEGEFSHEYWPKDSSSGEYMVFGASRSPQEHEHDTEDYEIFLWKVGSDPGKATRLTFHTGNDNWPDVYVAPK